MPQGREFHMWFPKHKNYHREGNNYDSDGAGNLGDVSFYTEEYDSSDVLVVRKTKSKNDWVMDSRCTFHMCPRKSLFCKPTEVGGGRVLLEKIIECKIMGIGDLKLTLPDGTIKTLTKVRYVPRLWRNLISLGTLEYVGYSIKLDKGTPKFIKGTMVVLKGAKENDLYLL